MESLLLLLYFFLSGIGDSPSDLLTLIDAEAYFKLRAIEVSQVNLEQLARTEPIDGKTQTAQLLAIRWLGEHRATNAEMTLQQIASGKIAQDALGFSQEYALDALARMHGRPIPVKTAVKGSLKEGLRWFPQKTAFIGALDLRAKWATQPYAAEAFPELNLKGLMGAWGRDKNLYDFAEAVGNIRLLRASAAYALSAPPALTPRFFLRLTGKADHGRLKEYFRQTLGPATVREQKGPKEELITVVLVDEHYALLLVGDSELIMVAPGDEQKESAVREFLDLYSGRKPNLFDGPLAHGLQDIAPNVSGLLMGEVPDFLAKDWAAPNVPFEVIPRSLVVSIFADKDVDFHFQGTFQNVAEANKFVEQVRHFKSEQLQNVKSLPPAPWNPVLTQVFDTIKVETDGAVVKGAVHIPGDLPKAMGEATDEAVQELGAALVNDAVVHVASVTAFWLIVLLVVAVLIAAVIVGGVYLFCIKTMNNQRA